MTFSSSKGMWDKLKEEQKCMLLITDKNRQVKKKLGSYDVEYCMHYVIQKKIMLLYLVQADATIVSELNHFSMQH